MAFGAWKDTLLLATGECGCGELTGKMSEGCLCFPQRYINAWNNLSEDIVSTMSVHSFKEKLDNGQYGDGATRA